MNKKKIIATIIIILIIIGLFLITRPMIKNNQDKTVNLVTDDKGNVLTKGGAIIPNDEYNRLLGYYEDDEIDEMNDQAVVKAWEYIDNNFYCSISNNVYAKMKKGICQNSEEYFYCLKKNDDGTQEYIKSVSGTCE